MFFFRFVCRRCCLLLVLQLHFPSIKYFLMNLFMFPHSFKRNALECTVTTAPASVREGETEWKKMQNDRLEAYEMYA